jgi:membrane fusion protein (multidrug efflux system)
LLTEIDLPNKDDLLRPGLYAYATIVAEEHKGAITVPSTAVVKDGTKAFCAVVADGKVRRAEIKTGIVEGKRTEILAGVNESDKVVEANAASLVDGQSVEVAKPVVDTAAKPKS